MSSAIRISGCAMDGLHIMMSACADTKYEDQIPSQGSDGQNCFFCCCLLWLMFILSSVLTFRKVPGCLALRYCGVPICTYPGTRVSIECMTCYSYMIVGVHGTTPTPGRPEKVAMNEKFSFVFLIVKPLVYRNSPQVSTEQGFLYIG